ncbi:M28 family peptidase [Agilicoccus flavus]|uniref:M28 family peptidase n=1 Tax=Agilicoccus flavus TaxID=2775968 RepID=UPI001CF667D8|nr:M28 family peptidase [Agilicoccus flavus]
MRAWAATLLALMILALAAVIGVASRLTPEPAALDAPADRFSSARARAALEPIAGSPRVPGTPAHARARDHLVAQLRGLGLETRVVPGIGYAHLPGKTLPVTAAARVDSILATRRGTGRAGTVVLAAHYDTVPGSPGAGDDGIGIATALEVARIVAAEPPGGNDVAVLFTDGEEAGLTGAQAFVRDHGGPLRAPVVVVNHEARGAAGRPVTVRTSGDLTALLRRTPRPEVESATEVMFGFAPNNTDFSIFREAGWSGLDTATVGDGWSYHTPADDLAHLDPGSLQQMGDSTLALTPDLLHTDLAGLDRKRDGLATTLPWGVVAFPSWSVAPLAGLALVLTLVATWSQRVRGRLTIRGTLAGLLLAALVVAGAGLAATACWEIARLVEPGLASVLIGEPARPRPFLVAELLAALAVFVVVVLASRRRPGLPALAHGGLLLVTGLTLTGALLLPAVVTWVVVPVLAASLGLVAAAVLRRGAGLPVITVALVPAAWMAGGQLSGLSDTGVGTVAPLIGATAGFLLLLVVAPILAFGSRRTTRGAHETDEVEGACDPRRRRLRAIGAGAGVLAIAIAVPAGATWAAMALDTSSGAPRQERATVTIDPATATARWDTSGRTPWGRSTHDRTARVDPAAFPAPTVNVIADRTDAAGRHLSLRVASSRAAPGMRLALPSGRLTAVTVDGIPAPAPAGGALLLSGLRGEPVAVGLTVAGVNGDLVLDVADESFELTAVPGYAGPPPDVLLVGPAVTVPVRRTLPASPDGPTARPQAPDPLP